MMRADLRRLVADILDVDPALLMSGTDLSAYETFDSVNRLSLQLALEEAGVSVSPVFVQSVHTFGEIEALLDEPASARSLADPSTADAEAALAQGRSACEQGDFNGAAQTLRAALADTTRTDFLLRAEPLVRKLFANVESAATIRLALLSNHTTTFAEKVLTVLGFRDRIRLELYTPPYGSATQDVLDPASGLHAFAPDVVILAFSWRDLGWKLLATDHEGDISRAREDCESLWHNLRERHGCTILQLTFDAPAYDPLGRLSREDLRGFRARVDELNRRLRACAPEGLFFVETQEVATTVSYSEWENRHDWVRSQQHPGLNALPELGERYLAILRALRGLTKKVLVVDLDHTLWGGVIGEDGLGGIAVGPGDPVGEAFADFQSYLKSLQERGVLLAVCSKNNEADARQPFEEHEGMILRLDDFAAFVANWQDKASNLHEIAQRLNVGLDSLVFVDDNPAECALVRQELPEVAVVPLPPHPVDFVPTLDRRRFFEALALSSDDLRRHETYRGNQRREALRASAPSLEAFLHGLAMIGRTAPVGEATLNRAVQLLARTNQFNLTTRRHEAPEVRRIAEDPASFAQTFALEDRFGDNGIIGLILAIPGEDLTTWEIDTWLMSCRVIGRGVEYWMTNELAFSARTAGKTKLLGTYRPTSKNELVRDHFAQMGFTKVAEAPDGTTHWELNIADFMVWPHSIVVD